ncbi:MAG: hypothetical protein SPJ81_06720 [Lachnoclostridium sp.]|nr:hypothetical protein [Lachnoclostridium sp.]
MKNSKRIVAVFLAGTMSFSMVIPALAADVPSEKEEVVYINLDAGGGVKDLNVVNIFGRGEVVDYGNYDSITMMNTNDKVSRDGDKITFSTDSDRVYYKGKMSNKEIPWNISIRYYLDGKEYSAEELAGRSGSLKICLKITENEDCPGDFFENYALQASFTLNTEKCTNIVAENATLANVGKNKQISYTMLPGKGIDTTVTADVEDFEMSAVAINGVPLSLDVEVNDEELMGQVTELLDAIEQIDDGTGELKDGTVKLQDGVKGELQNGATALNTGIVSLNFGITEIKKGLNELNGKSPELTEGSAEIYGALQKIQSSLEGVSISTEKLEELSASSTAILSGITELSDGIMTLYNSVNVDGYKAAMRGESGQGVDELRTANSEAIEQISPLVGQIDEVIAILLGYTDMPLVGDIVNQIINMLNAVRDPLSNIAVLLETNNQCIDGTQAYIAAVHENIRPLAEGASQLKDSYAQFDQAIQEMVGTLSGLVQNVTELKAGISTLVSEYEKLDTGINEYTSGVAQIVAGYSQVSNGSISLVKGSSELAAGTNNLYEGTTDLLSGITELKEGTGELCDKTSGMDTEISDKIDQMMESITGGDLKTVSFVSDKNVNVDAVQFVIQTEAITLEDVIEVESSEKEQMTIWEKFLNLFGKKS